MIKDCRTEEDFDQLLADSQDTPVFLFKHSTRCSISAGRWAMFQGYADREARAVFCKLLVIENRPLSMHVAQKTGIRHQSPQAILFCRGEPVWDASHYSITEENMTAALKRALS